MDSMATVNAVIGKTAEFKGKELLLIESRSAIEAPEVKYKAKAVFYTPPSLSSTSSSSSTSTTTTTTATSV